MAKLSKAVQKVFLLWCFRNFPKDKCMEVYSNMLVDENKDVQGVLPDVKKILRQRGFLNG